MFCRPPRPPSDETAGAARTAAPAGAPWTAASARPAESSASELAPGAAAASRAEALGELAGCRVELAAADGLQAVVHHAAVHVRHVAGDRERLCRSVSREARGEQCSRGLRFAFGRHDVQRRGGTRLRLHGELFEALAASGLRLRAASRSACLRRRARVAAGAAPGAVGALAGEAAAGVAAGAGAWRGARVSARSTVCAHEVGDTVTSRSTRPNPVSSATK